MSQNLIIILLNLNKSKTLYFKQVKILVVICSDFKQVEKLVLLILDRLSCFSDGCFSDNCFLDDFLNSCLII